MEATVTKELKAFSPDKGFSRRGNPERRPEVQEQWATGDRGASMDGEDDSGHKTGWMIHLS